MEYERRVVRNRSTIWEHQIHYTNPDGNPSTIPAIYATALKGTDGQDYLLVTNKSFKVHAKA